MTAAYALAMAVMLLTGGRLGDVFGRRRMLLIGATGFTLASVAAAAAPSMEVLIAARALQGGLGAIMLPQTFGLIRELFGPDEMGKAWGILGPVAGLSAILGPVLAGLLIQVADWRAIFLVNLPIGAFVVLAGRKLLPDGRADGDLAQDRPARLPARRPRHGPARLPARPGPRARLAAVDEADARRGAAGAGAVRRDAGRPQARRRRAAARAVVFTKRSYVSGIVFAAVFLGTMGGLTLTLTVLLQLGLGYTPIHASLSTAPYALGGFAGAAAGAILLARLGRTILQAGLVVKLVGLLGVYAGHSPRRHRRRHVGPRRAAVHRRHRHGRRLRAAVRHRPGRRRAARDRLRLRRAAGVPAARHVARDRRPRHASSSTCWARGRTWPTSSLRRSGQA